MFQLWTLKAGHRCQTADDVGPEMQVTRLGAGVVEAAPGITGHTLVVKKPGLPIAGDWKLKVSRPASQQ